jgi:predicted nucleic acid-binding protein
MRYIIDADLVLEGLLVRPNLSSDAARVWKQIESSDDKGYITSIGLGKISKAIRLLVPIEQKADEIIDFVSSVFEEIEVDRPIIQDALELDLSSKDFESAVEIICAKELEINDIITDRKDYFPFLNSKNKFLDGFALKIMDAQEYISESKKNAKESIHEESKSCEGDRKLLLINTEESPHQEAKFSKDDCNPLLITSGFKEMLTPYATKSPQPNLNENVATILNQHESTSAVGDLENLFLDYPDLMIEFGITFVDKYGGEDIDDYYERYDIIKNHWPILKYILDFCYYQASSGHKDYYSKFMTIWNRLNRFCDLYGYWDNRIEYLNLAIELSSQYQMDDELFNSLTRKAWTLIMQNKLGDAKKNLKRAAFISRQQKKIKNSSLCFNFYHCLFTFYARSNDPIKAEEAFVELAYLAKALEEEQVDDASLKRRKINIARNSAKLDYLQAIEEENSKLSKELIERSLTKYLLCLKDAVSLGWKRGICYLHNKIADIYIHKAEDIQESVKKREKFLKNAETYLDQAQNIAVRNHNQRRIAGYLLSYARISMLKADCLKESAPTDKISLEDSGDELGRQTRQEIYQEAIYHSTQAKNKYQELKNKTKVKECNEVIEECEKQQKQLTKC